MISAPTKNARFTAKFINCFGVEDEKSTFAPSIFVREDIILPHPYKAILLPRQQIKKYNTKKISPQSSMGGKSSAGFYRCVAAVERGGDDTPAAQPCELAGGGAMGEAMRPAKMHAGEKGDSPFKTGG